MNCFMFSEHISENNVQRIVFLKSGKIAVISKNGRQKEEGPCIYLLDNKLNLLSILDKNEIYAGSSLNLIELHDGRIISFSRSPILRLWNRFGNFLEDWENPFFTRGIIQLSGGRIVSICGTCFVIREENGRKIKTVNASKSGWQPVRIIKNLSGDRFLTDDLCGEKYLWNKNGRKIECFPVPVKKTEIRIAIPAKYPEICYFDEYGNCCCIENQRRKK